MSVVEIREGDHLGGSFTDSAYTVRVTYHVTCESGDGADTIRRHAKFRVGNEYSFKGDSNAAMRLESADPRPRYGKEKQAEWEVTCVYSTNQKQVGGGQGNSPPGGGSDDNEDKPGLEFAPQFGTRVWYYRKVQTQCRFVRQVVTELGVPREDSKRLGGKWDSYVGPALNSALKPIQPQPEIERGGIAIRQSGGWAPSIADAYYNESLVQVGKVNTSELVLVNPAGTVRHICQPFTVKLDSVQLLSHDGGETFIPVEYEWLWKPDGWIEAFPDVGSTIVVEAVSGAGDAVAEMHSDEAAIREMRGGIVTDDQPLDGRGQLNRNPGFQQYTIEYLLDDTTDFRALSAKPYTGAW